MKRFGGQPELYLDEKEFKTDLGKDNFIFVGSGCDMWAKSIPAEWILETLEHCKKYNNKYLFQSKNPKRFGNFRPEIPKNVVLGTTIESDMWHMCMGNTPLPYDRAVAMSNLSLYYSTMVTVEPILECDPLKLFNLIALCSPAWANIGADSKGHGLPEPEPNKIAELIEKLWNNGIKYKLKDNLKRLFKGKEKLWNELKSHEIKL